MARSSLAYVWGFFFEIFLSADIYRLCKLGELGGHLGWKSGSPDKVLEGGPSKNHFSSLVEIGSVVSEEKSDRDGPWVGPFQNCVRQPRLPFKMAAVTKNRNFFKWPKLLYFKQNVPKFEL
jgi:hypothetical protein